eukprot:TRINITY_DN1884_c0_g1_i2.p1 TRINITY_DN1884_c0_g1~~TRINITY_DN1884_c0_g1_i2.p1  ORF type:complete len:202 (+),score=39.28 TRINITY_DN1884_c0_g1_i2:63-668(+)
MAQMKFRVLLALVVCGPLSLLTEALRFVLPGVSQKCFDEDLRVGFKMSFEYKIERNIDYDVTLTVSSPMEANIFQKVNPDKGTFNFHPKEIGAYRFCFTSALSDFHYATYLDGVTFVEFKLEPFDLFDNPKDVPTRGSLMPSEIQLRNLERLLNEIQQNLVEMKEREASLYHHNGQYLCACHLFMFQEWLNIIRNLVFFDA